MEKLPEPFKQDNRKLWYLDDSDIEVKEFYFAEIGKSFKSKRSFFKIDGMNDYIIKDSTMYPLVFNGPKNKKLLRNISSKQELLPEIGFPVGYYRKHGMMNGIVIPYYDGAAPLRTVMYLTGFKSLPEYYYHSSDEIDNLICMLLDILNLISKMYDKGVSYLDIHSGNFLFYNNGIKVIDFDYGYVLFDKKDKYFDRIIRNYDMLVETICRRFGFKDILFNRDDTFMETEHHVKSLKRELRR